MRIANELKVIDADPDDDKVLECAVLGSATHIVTGDRRHLLPLGSFHGIRIVTPAEFLALTGAKGRARTMLVRMTHIGGPLDGMIEFEEGSPWSEGEDHVDSLARGTYELTNGQVGKGAMSAGPAAISALQSGSLSREDSGRTTLHRYYITSNEVRDGIRYVVAEHRPEYRV